MDKKKMPVLFIGHGSPMNVVANNDFVRDLVHLEDEIPKPEAILVVSAHWLTRGICITGQKELPQIYDFYGFPEKLYQIAYHAKGAPGLAARIVTRIGGDRISIFNDWGLDHGAWTVLKFLAPQEDVPVLELSIDVGKSEKEHYKFAKSLRFLRDEGVLVIGSGNVVHNLELMQWKMDADPFPWARDAEAEIKRLLKQGEHGKLVGYRQHLPDADLAVPTNDHYLPMLYVIGMQEAKETIAFPHEGIQNASISMLCFKIG